VSQQLLALPATPTATALRLVPTAVIVKSSGLRRGTVVDIAPLVEMHDRCSAETLARRYHAPMRRLRPRMARAVLLPSNGFSLVLEEPTGAGIAAIGMVTFRDDDAEAALLVEDRWQRRGHGARLLRALGVEAARLGAEELTLIVQRDDAAVLATVRRAGMRWRRRSVDGKSQLQVSLSGLASTAHAESLGARSRTAPLVALLHARSDLRGIYAPADLIDRAVRDGV
jgi:GNAT superfamily N-acetyltransferase